MRETFEKWHAFISKSIAFEKSIVEESEATVGVVMYHKGMIDAYRYVLSMMEKTYTESEVMDRTVYEMLQDIIEWIEINDSLCIWKGFCFDYYVCVEGLLIADSNLERAIRQVWSRLQTESEE